MLSGTGSEFLFMPIMLRSKKTYALTLIKATSHTFVDGCESKATASLHSSVETKTSKHKIV